MGMQVGDRKGGPMADINVTPLVDVVLVLLIIFMVVTPMLSSGVDVALPTAKTATETQDVGQHLVVSIRDDDAIFVDTTRSSPDTLLDDIKRGYAEDPSRSLLIKADRSLKWKQVAKVMETIRDGGVSTMLMATESEDE